VKRREGKYRGVKGQAFLRALPCVHIAGLCRVCGRFQRARMQLTRQQSKRCGRDMHLHRDTCTGTCTCTHEGETRAALRSEAQIPGQHLRIRLSLLPAHKATAGRAKALECLRWHKLHTARRAHPAMAECTARKLFVARWSHGVRRGHAHDVLKPLRRGVRVTIQSAVLAPVRARKYPPPPFHYHRPIKYPPPHEHSGSTSVCPIRPNPSPCTLHLAIV
jgi:hypothetical protein